MQLNGALQADRSLPALAGCWIPSNLVKINLDPGVTGISGCISTLYLRVFKTNLFTIRFVLWNC